METKVNGLGGIGLAMTLIGVVCAGAARAQPAADGGNNLPQPRTQAASCADVAWEENLLARYPRIGDACQEVVMSEGRKWARFEADLVRAYADGRVTLDFKDRRGSSIEQITLMPAHSQRVSIDGRSVEFKDVERAQELNLYLPEGTFAMATEPGAPLEELAEIVLAPVERRSAAVSPEPAQAVTEPLLAQADRAPGRTPAVLPDTAGPLPLFALAGLLSMLGGLALTIRRRFLARE
jgi:hypothetical protein